MGAAKQQFVTDDHGKKVAVILPIKEYKRLLEEADELECIKAYDKAKLYIPEFIPAKKAFREIDAQRRQR